MIHHIIIGVFFQRVGICLELDGCIKNCLESKRHIYHKTITDKKIIYLAIPM